MATDNSFYFASVRRMLIAFATLFDDMYILRKNKYGITEKTLKIPFEYGSKQHWYRKLQEANQRQEGRAKVNLTLPRMSFVLRQAAYDAQRKRNTMNSIRYITDEGEKKRQLAPVPYNLEVEMNVLANTMEDLLMIFEQIVPMFSPQINLRIRELDEMDIWSDLDITLSGPPTFDDNVEETFETNRLVSVTFNCLLKGNIYPPTRDNKIIHQAIVDQFDQNQYLESVVVTANDIESGADDKIDSTTEILDREL